MKKKSKKQLEINRIGNKNCWIKMDFSTGGWLIGGRPNGLLIRGDHLFLNYQFVFGQWWLINRGGLLILTWHYFLDIYRCYCICYTQNDKAWDCSRGPAWRVFCALSQVRQLCKGILKFQMIRTVPRRRPWHGRLIPLKTSKKKR